VEGCCGIIGEEAVEGEGLVAGARGSGFRAKDAKGTEEALRTTDFWGFLSLRPAGACFTWNGIGGQAPVSRETGALLLPQNDPAVRGVGDGVAGEVEHGEGGAEFEVEVVAGQDVVRGVRGGARAEDQGAALDPG